jgi:hypothetical protein
MSTAIAVATMKAAQVSNPGSSIQIVEREIPQPRAGHVRIKVQACGVCHSDQLTKDGAWPGIQYPRVPGHEIAHRRRRIPDSALNRKNPKAAARSPSEASQGNIQRALRNHKQRNRGTRY